MPNKTIILVVRGILPEFGHRISMITPYCALLLRTRPNSRMVWDSNFESIDHKARTLPQHCWNLDLNAIKCQWFSYSARVRLRHLYSGKFFWSSALTRTRTDFNEIIEIIENHFSKFLPLRCRRPRRSKDASKSFSQLQEGERLEYSGLLSDDSPVLLWKSFPALVGKVWWPNCTSGTTIAILAEAQFNGKINIQNNLLKTHSQKASVCLKAEAV